VAGPSKRRRSRQTHKPSVMLSPVICAFCISATFLLTFHVTADQSSSVPPHDDAAGNFTFYERIQRGPEALHSVDKILFCSLILLAFELLNYLTQHSGRTCDLICEIGCLLEVCVSLIAASFLQNGSARL
jgi:hypothetical protein